MITSKDLEYARRVWVAAMGTDRERAAHADYLLLVEQAKREHKPRVVS